MHAIKKGFTLIEMSIAIAFIGVLSLTIALIITNVISAYRRGLTLNQVNTIGAAIVEDIRSTLKESTVRGAVGLCDDLYHGLNDFSQTKNCEEDNGHMLNVVIKEASVQIGSETSDVPVYGALCTGSYSYIWNSGYFFNSDYIVDEGNMAAAILKYEETISNLNDTKTVTWTNENGDTKFKLLKVKDSDRKICQSQLRTDKYEMKTADTNSDGKKEAVFSIGVLEDKPVDILRNSSGTENNLAIYSLDTSIPALNEDSHSAFYQVSLILGTVQGCINIASKGNFCTAPKDYENSSVENFDYCSINKFNFAVQANGG